MAKFQQRGEGGGGEGPDLEHDTDLPYIALREALMRHRVIVLY